MSTFKNWMREHYDNQELESIRDHGCESGCACGLIYYSETSAIYDEFSGELHEILGDWVNEIGFIPNYIAENIGCDYQFKNAVVWAIAEYYANDLLCELESEAA